MPNDREMTHSKDYYGNRERQRTGQLDKLFDERSKIEGDILNRGGGGPTPAEQKRLEEIEAERKSLQDQGERDEKERNSGLPGESLDRLDELEKESKSRQLTPEEAKELQDLKRAVDNAPPDPPAPDADPGPPQIGGTDNGRDLAGPPDDLSGPLSDRGGALPGPEGGRQPVITPDDLKLGPDRDRPGMEENSPRPGPSGPDGAGPSTPDGGGSAGGSGSGGGSGDTGGGPAGGAGSAGGGSAGGGSGDGGGSGGDGSGSSAGSGGSGGDGGSGHGDGGPGSGAGGGAAARGYVDGPDTPGVRRQLQLGRGRLGLSEAVRHRLGNVIDHLDGPTRVGAEHGSGQHGGHVVGDPGPNDGPLRTPTAEERDRFRRPGSDPRVTDPPDDGDRF